MYCRKCGKIIANDSIYCNYCGENQREELRVPVIVEINGNDSIFTANSLDKDIMSKLYSELIKYNTNLKNGLKFEYRNGRYILEDRFFKINTNLRHECMAYSQKYFLMEGFTQTIIPDGSGRHLVFEKK